MSCIVLTHLGPSIPSYIKECCHQIRLWNPHSFPIYLLLEGNYHLHSPFFLTLQNTYDVTLVYTEGLKPTEDHLKFHTYLKENQDKWDPKFRNGYWRFVKERFYFLEELMRAKELKNIISMEYDILVYADIRQNLFNKFQTSHQTLRVVKDNEVRAHPGFMYIPTAEVLEHFNAYLVTTLDNKWDDMKTLEQYGATYPTRLNFLPCITEKRNQTVKPRKSLNGTHSVEDPWFLSQDSEHFGFLFDSAVVGQAVGGVDPRNSEGKKITQYANESALYNIMETQGTGWAQSKDTNKSKSKCKKWFFVMDNRPVVTIHMHSKALKQFLSDREDMPKADYDVEELMKTLEKN